MGARNKASCEELKLLDRTEEGRINKGGEGEEDTDFQRGRSFYSPRGDLLETKIKG